MSAKKYRNDQLNFETSMIYQADLEESVDSAILYSTFLLHQNPGELCLRRHRETSIDSFQS